MAKTKKKTSFRKSLASRVKRKKSPRKTKQTIKVSAPKSKRISGQNFKRDKVFKTKAEAITRQKKLRKDTRENARVRVVPVKNGYGTFFRFSGDI